VKISLKIILRDVFLFLRNSPSMVASILWTFKKKSPQSSGCVWLGFLSAFAFVKSQKPIKEPGFFHLLLENLLFRSSILKAF
jgi:hypothetical protein